MGNLKRKFVGYNYRVFLLFDIFDLIACLPACLPAFWRVEHVMATTTTMPMEKIGKQSKLFNQPLLDAKSVNSVKKANKNV